MPFFNDKPTPPAGTGGLRNSGANYPKNPATSGYRGGSRRARPPGTGVTPGGTTQPGAMPEPVPGGNPPIGPSNGYTPHDGAIGNPTYERPNGYRPYDPSNGYTPHDGAIGNPTYERPNGYRPYDPEGPAGSPEKLGGPPGGRPQYPGPFDRPRQHYAPTDDSAWLTNPGSPYLTYDEPEEYDPNLDQRLGNFVPPDKTDPKWIAQNDAQVRAQGMFGDPSEWSTMRVQDSFDNGAGAVVETVLHSHC